MSEKVRIKNEKHSFIIISVILFLVLSCSLVIDAARNNSQAEWAIVPDIRLIGEYKIADGEWKDIVEGEHIPATKGDVMLRGVLEICDPETNDFYGKLTKGSLMYFTFNHINLALTENEEITVVYDIENPVIGEDACGYNSMVIEYNGKDGYFEGVIRNYHSFGNEGAVDEFLSSMKLYASDYSEKTALRSGKSERLIAIMILISGLLVLGLAIFSYLLDKSTFKSYLFGGLLILSAGIFFLFTSKAIYLWFDFTIVNTMLEGLSAMAYLLFAFVLIKELFSGKAEKAAGIATLLYGVFISSLIAVSLFSGIYFYNLLGVWVVGAVTFSVMFMVLLLLSLKGAVKKEKIEMLFSIIGIAVLWLDISAIYFGLWRIGFASKIYFLIGFIISVVVFLRIVPKNIKAAEKAEQLEKEKITLDAELARSRISTLMSQIHPHFIYNTLGSIEQLCELDPPKAAKLVNDFSKYLRGNFGEIDNTRLIRVSKELEHTEYYIGIEKVRFPDIEFITEKSCCDFSVPALTVQPIVENAVKHGILKREAGGTVRVRIYETDSSYFITVKDNGVGFDVSELNNDNHIGLRNIRSRLEAMCSGILHIESILGVGTKITVEIPKEADR
ncbi:MAG: histidine kinase [Clostridia bacterium]|nr:histidine kinase [Clostridia bacterium]